MNKKQKALNNDNVQIGISQELDERLARHERKETVFFSWDEIKIELSTRLKTNK